MRHFAANGERNALERTRTGLREDLRPAHSPRDAEPDARAAVDRGAGSRLLREHLIRPPPSACAGRRSRNAGASPRALASRPRRRSPERSGTTCRGHPLEITMRTVAGRRTRIPAPGLSSTTVAFAHVPRRRPAVADGEAAALEVRLRGLGRSAGRRSTAPARTASPCSRAASPRRRAGASRPGAGAAGRRGRARHACCTRARPRRSRSASCAGSARGRHARACAGRSARGRRDRGSAPRRIHRPALRRSRRGPARASGAVRRRGFVRDAHRRRRDRDGRSVRRHVPRARGGCDAAPDHVDASAIARAVARASGLRDGSRLSSESTMRTADSGAAGDHTPSDGASSCARRSPIASRSSPSNGSRPLRRR